MWKESKLLRVWETLYPVGMYLVVSNLLMLVAEMILSDAADTYLVRHILVTAVAFPLVWSYYRNPPAYCIGKVKEAKNFRPSVLLLAAVCGMACSVLLNDLIRLTPLISHSESYRQVSEAFSGGSLFLLIAATCILTPVLEEMLYRGVAYLRLRSWLGILPSAFCSAALFGAMHMNLVQFVYAGLLGFLLAWLMEHFSLAASTAAHIGANLISVLRSEFPGLNNSAGPESAASFVIGALAVWLLLLEERNVHAKKQGK